MENCFQNMNCFSWIKLIPTLIHLKHLYSNSLNLVLPSLTISVKFYPKQLKPFFNTILIIFFIEFTILSNSIWPRATTSIGYTKPYVKPIKLYADHNTLLVKQATHKKIESFRAASLSKLDNTFNNNSIFNTKYA